MTGPTASVVIPSRGGAQRLPRLLASLQAQDHPDVETVVVLDGDVDGSEEVVRAWGDRLDLHVVVFPENRGRSAALNAGHEAARGEVLIRCDDDLEPGPQFVSRHVTRHADGPRGVIGLYLNVLQDSRYATVYGRPRDELFRTAAYATAPGDRWRYWAGNVSTTRELWQRVGPYDTAYRTYGLEDVDWGWRLARTGVPIVIAPELETLHHTPSVSSGVRARRAFAAGAAHRTFTRIQGEGILPESATGTGVWDHLVRGMARHLDEARVVTSGDVIDRALPILPRYLGEKSVALLVEAASVAGRNSRRAPDASV